MTATAFNTLNVLLLAMIPLCFYRTLSAVKRALMQMCAAHTRKVSKFAHYLHSNV